MNRITLTITTFAMALGLPACVPHQKPRQNSSRGPNIADTRPIDTPDEYPPDEPVKVKKPNDELDPAPVLKKEVIPPPPRSNPDYAVKVIDKPGYVKSPYDAQGRLIDVRGLPPGTEAECPYTHKTFLVPP